MQIEKHPIQFFTAVCNDWQQLLLEDRYKDIVIEALRHRVALKQIKVSAFVIMPNHIHLIWRIQNEFKLEDVQRDFLKFTAKEIMSVMKREKGEKSWNSLYVDLKDRKFQVWKRNSMSIDLFSDKFFRQKLEYIHDNPCQPHWNLAIHPQSYRYSSCSYYETGKDEFGVITHFEEL